MSSEVNLFTPLITSLCDVCKVSVKLICDCLGIKTYDFNSLFRNMKFKNADEVYPRLYKRDETDYFDIFEFSIPIGMSISDFKKKEDAFAQFFKVETTKLMLGMCSGRHNHKLIQRLKMKLIQATTPEKRI